MKKFRIAHTYEERYGDDSFKSWWKGPYETKVEYGEVVYILRLKEVLYYNTLQEAQEVANMLLDCEPIKEVEFNETFIRFAKDAETQYKSYGTFSFNSRKNFKKEVLSKLTNKFEKEFIRFLFSN